MENRKTRRQAADLLLNRIIKDNKIFCEYDDKLLIQTRHKQENEVRTYYNRTFKNEIDLAYWQYSDDGKSVKFWNRRKAQKCC
eukprot:UN27513